MNAKITNNIQQILEQLNETIKLQQPSLEGEVDALITSKAPTAA